MNDGLPALRDVINAHSLQAKKSFGQNFLLDLNLTARIARVPGDLSHAAVYEVGPGPGGLTRALLSEGAKRLVAVEMDSRCLPALEEVSKAYSGALTVHEGDALKIDELTLIKPLDNEPVHIVSNLPYNVGTALLVKWLTLKEWKPWYQSLTLMFQKEVAERIVAKPGCKAYGRLSVLAQWRGKVKLAFTVPRQAFTPPPKVTSAIIHFTPTEPLDTEVELADLEMLVAKAFNQRRKMLRSALKGIAVDPVTLLTAAGIKPTDRAEDVTVGEYVKLAREYKRMRSS